MRVQMRLTWILVASLLAAPQALVADEAQAIIDAAAGMPSTAAPEAPSPASAVLAEAAQAKQALGIEVFVSGWVASHYVKYSLRALAALKAEGFASRLQSLSAQCFSGLPITKISATTSHGVGIDTFGKQVRLYLDVRDPDLGAFLARRGAECETALGRIQKAQEWGAPYRISLDVEAFYSGRISSDALKSALSEIGSDQSKQALSGFQSACARPIEEVRISKLSVYVSQDKLTKVDALEPREGIRHFARFKEACSEVLPELERLNAVTRARDSIQFVVNLDELGSGTIRSKGVLAWLRFFSDQEQGSERVAALRKAVLASSDERHYPQLKQCLAGAHGAEGDAASDACSKKELVPVELCHIDQDAGEIKAIAWVVVPTPLFFLGGSRRDPLLQLNANDPPSVPVVR
jgi:hypothetical protein